MTHHSKISAAVFAKIVNGSRRIEPRLNDPSHKQVKIGDLIIFLNRQTGEEALAKVVGVLRFSNFGELFDAFGPSYFGLETRAEQEAEVRGWYSAEEEKAHGVLGIKIHVLKSRKDESD